MKRGRLTSEFIFFNMRTFLVASPHNGKIFEVELDVSDLRWFEGMKSYGNLALFTIIFMFCKLHWTNWFIAFFSSPIISFLKFQSFFRCHIWVHVRDWRPTNRSWYNCNQISTITLWNLFSLLHCQALQDAWSSLLS